MLPAPARQRQSDDENHNLVLRAGTWHVRYKIGGQPRSKSTGESDVRKARKARDRILKEVENRRSGIIHETEKTWEDAVNGYLTLTETLIRQGSLSQKTVDRYSTSFVQLTLALAGEPDEDGNMVSVPLSQISIGTITDFIIARQEEGRSSQTILNDLTAMSRVLAFAVGRGWLEHNLAKSLDRKMFVGVSVDELNPPNDDQASDLVDEVGTWNPSMSILFRFLRETGMRLAEALNLRADDIHPDGLRATLIKGVKRNKDGLKTRTINLGRAADLLDGLPKRGRLFAALNVDSAVTSTRYGQWRRQRQRREDLSATDEGRDAEALQTFRIHDLRHAFAIASLIDDPTCIYRLSEHLGHSSVKTTEEYLRFLRGAGAHRRYSRKTDLFGSLPKEP